MIHENTRIYSRSRELIRFSAALIAKLPPGHAFLADQLRRASTSVLFNFGEGCAHTSAKERKRFFTMSRGSAKECSTIFDAAQDLGVVDDVTHSQGTDLCDHVAAMLWRYR